VSAATKVAASHPHLATQRVTGALPQETTVELVVVSGAEIPQLLLHLLQVLLRHLLPA